MKVHFLPSSRAGKWAAGLVIGAILVFLLLIVFGELLDFLPETFITVAGSLSVAAAIMAAITGLSALTKFQDRALLVILAVIFGLATIVFILTNMAIDLL